MRPTSEDTQALEQLLDMEDVREFDAGFLESLYEWNGEWTPKQCAYFDKVCQRYIR